MKRAATLAAASLLALGLSACATPQTSVGFADVEDPVSFANTERRYDGIFSNRPAVQRVKVPGNFFLSVPVNQDAPRSLLNREVELELRGKQPTLSDLQMLLDVQGIPVTIDFRSLEVGDRGDAEVQPFAASSRYQDIPDSITSGDNRNGSGMLGGYGRQSSGQSERQTEVDQEGSLFGDYSSQSRSVSTSGGNVAPVAATKEPESAPGTTENPPVFFDRILPFRRFQGTIGELIRRLESAGNIAVWYDGGLVLGDVRRYSVALIQNKDMIQSVVNELQRLGARDVVGSIGAGQVFYSAPPRTNADIIVPYLERLSGNLSEVTLQVALVTVQMTRDNERGFDWSKFNLTYGSTAGAESGGGRGGDYGGVGGSGGDVPQLRGDGLSLSNDGFDLNIEEVSLFGATNPLNVSGALRYLSTMGETSVAQNVELRTLSGAPVKLRSGEDVPYVSGVGANFAGGLGSGIASNANTESVQTGLTVNIDPRYDSSSGIVTMDLGLKLVDLIEFVELNAGNQLGTFTQPRTREQAFNSILRLAAGQTSVIGGIRRDLSSEDRTGPLGLYEIGSRSRSREVFWLFAVIRPVVTVYVTEDMPVPARSVLDTVTTVNPLEPGSYGVEGGERPVTPVYDDPQVPHRGGGVPTYYEEDPGAFTPANRQPAGVATSAPPAPRNVVVPGAATQPEVDTHIPAGTVLRQPTAPAPSAPSYPIEEEPAVQRPVPDQPVEPVRDVPTATREDDGFDFDDAQLEQGSADAPRAAEEGRKSGSFIRPMTAAEKERHQ